MSLNRTYDLNMRIDRTGNMIKATRGEYICNIANMLFNLVPGWDEYEPKRGLAIRRKLQQTYAEQTRDSEYENEIVSQFTQYTDLIPNQVYAIYANKCLFIYMNILFEGDIYELDIQADLDSLTAMLRN